MPPKRLSVVRSGVALGCTLAAGVVVAIGCGGGDRSAAPVSPSGYGAIRIAINWPQTSETGSSRIILTSMTSIDISISVSGNLAMEGYPSWSVVVP